jgi:hypothetical protein
MWKYLIECNFKDFFLTLRFYITAEELRKFNEKQEVLDISLSK